EPLPAPRSDGLTGCVPITGAWAGAVTLDCPTALARRGGGAPLGAGPAAATAGPITAVVGEVANNAGGQFPAALPGPWGPGGAAEAAAWVGQGRKALLEGGAAGIQAHPAGARAGARAAAKREALDGAAGYFGRRGKYLGYAGRLAQGQSIGSGLVEGACKPVI